MLDNVTGPAYNVLSVVYNGQPVNDLSGGFFVNVQQVIGGDVTFSADQLDEFKDDGTQLSLSTLILKGSNISYSLDGLNLLMDSGFGFAAVASTENGATGVTLIGDDTNNEQLYSANTKGGNTLIAGNGTGDNLTVGVGSNTLTGGSGGDTFTVNGAGFPGDPVNVDVITGGSGNDTFNILGNLASGSSLAGGGGSDTLTANGNLSLASISGIGTLNNSHVTLTAGQLDGFSTLNFDTVYASAANTTYSLAGKTALYSTLDTNGFDNVTLVGADSGIDTLMASGNNDILIGGAGDDFFDVSFAGTGATITGNGGNDTLLAGADISGMSIAGDVGTLQIDYDGSVKLTAAQLANFTTIMGTSVFDPMTGTYSDPTGVLFVDGGTSGTVSLAGKTLVGDIVLDTTLTTGDVTLVASDSGSTLKAGSGNDTLTGGLGDDTLVAGAGNDSMTGGNGINTYAFTDPNSTGTYLINAFHTDAGQSVVQLAAGVTPGEVTVAQVGNDLKLDWANDPIIIQNYFLGDQYKVASVNFADGTVWSAAHLEELVAASNYTVLTAGDDDWANLQTEPTGNYKLIAGNGEDAQLSADNSAGNNILTVGNGDWAYLHAIGSSGNNIFAAGSGDGDLLDADDTTGNNTLTASGTNAVLGAEGSYGDNSLTATDGTGAILTVNDSNGNNTLTVGDGDGAFLSATGSTGDNTLMAGNGAGDRLSVDSSSGANILTAGDGDAVILSAQSSTGDNILTAGNGAGDIVEADDSLGDNTLTVGDGDNGMVSADFSFGTNTLIAGNGNGNTLSTYYATGSNSLAVGNGDDNSLTGGLGDDTLTVGTGTGNTLNGGGGNDTYNFGSAFGQDIITNFSSSATDPHGQITFGAGVTDQSLWFAQNGDALEIDLLGTDDKITVQDWFDASAAQVAGIHAGGMELDNGDVSQLIQAMASFSAHNGSFNPGTAVAMPADATLQAAITANWHS
jgi:Ca2+-binding RTX toxin-like protein